MTRSYLLFISNIALAACTPIFCRYLSVQAGHSRAVFSTISGNYLLTPERWVFAGLISLFVCIHLIAFGPISSRVLSTASEHLKNNGVMLELTMLGLFVLIAWIPAHLILGMHALLGGLLFSGSLLWMSTIEQGTPSGSFLHTLRNSLLIACTACLFGMLLYFPSDLISDLVRARGDLPRSLYLLGLDARWSNFALFEWAFYYGVLAFMLTCSP